MSNMERDRFERAVIRIIPELTKLIDDRNRVKPGSESTGGTFMKWSNEGLARYKKQYLHLDIAEIGRMALELGLIHRDEIDLFLNPQYFSELDLVDSRLRSLSQFIAQKRAKLGS
jgi:hypothetical protein